MGLQKVSVLQEKEKTRNIDKEVELLKIQIFSERTHARLTYLVSTTFAIFIGFSVVFYTLFYEKVLSLAAFSVSMIPISLGTVYEIYRIRENYRKELKKISDIIEEAKEGKELPKLEELINRRG